MAEHLEGLQLEMAGIQLDEASAKESDGGTYVEEGLVSFLFFSHKFKFLRTG